MPSLTVQIPGGEPQRYEFEEAHVMIGRSPDNSIIIDHDSLSTSHSQLVRNEDGNYTLMDLGSTNGTYVDGEQISEVVVPATANLAFGQVTAYWEGAGAVAEAGPAEAGGGFQLGEFELMGRPANFRCISPHPKSKRKKDPMAGVSMGLGLLSLLGAVLLVGAVLTMLK